MFSFSYIPLLSRYVLDTFFEIMLFSKKNTSSLRLIRGFKTAHLFYFALFLFIYFILFFLVHIFARSIEYGDDIEGLLTPEPEPTEISMGRYLLFTTKVSYGMLNHIISNNFSINPISG